MSPGLARLPEEGTARYGVVLVLVLLTAIFIMAVPDGRVASTVAFLLMGLSLVVALRSAGVDRRLRLVAALLFIAMLAVGIGLNLSDAGAGEGFVRAAGVALVLFATPAIGWALVRQVRGRREVTVHTMMGVLCIYLLVALGFANAFGAVAAISGDPFFSSGEDMDRLSAYLYFSFTTITTAGLGDLAPATDTGRSLTAAEVLFGQIYLVTIVALIVSQLGRRR